MLLCSDNANCKLGHLCYDLRMSVMRTMSANLVPYAVRLYRIVPESDKECTSPPCGGIGRMTHRRPCC